MGWIRLFEGPRLNAHVERETLSIFGIGDYSFRVAAPSLDGKMFQSDQRLMPGLTVKLDTDARGMDVKPGAGFIDVQYHEATKFTLHMGK